jgi:hypothetical protein
MSPQSYKPESVVSGNNKSRVDRTSFSQEALFPGTGSGSESEIRHRSLFFRLQDQVDVNVIRVPLRRLVAWHPVQPAVHSTNGDVVPQQPNKNVLCDFATVDAQNWEAATMRCRVAQDTLDPLALAMESVLCVRHYSVAQDDCQNLLCVHTVTADTQSLFILERRVRGPRYLRCESATPITRQRERRFLENEPGRARWQLWRDEIREVCRLWILRLISCTSRYRRPYAMGKYRWH